MDRRQDAKRALSESKDLKLNGNHIKMAWAPGKGFKEYKKLKDFWEVSSGSSYIPYGKIDSSIDYNILEEGGVIDEDSMSMEMKGKTADHMLNIACYHFITFTNTVINSLYTLHQKCEKGKQKRKKTRQTRFKLA